MDSVIEWTARDIIKNTNIEYMDRMLGYWYDKYNKGIFTADEMQTMYRVYREEKAKVLETRKTYNMYCAEQKSNYRDLR